MKNIAIIPARSGSKGLKDKNIKMLNEKPLMAYTIQAAISTGLFNEVMVSTDSKLYAEIAQKYGAMVPFLRTEGCSQDASGSWDVVKEVLKNYKEKLGKEFDTFCLLQPTSPLRQAEDIVNAYSLYEEKKASTIVSVCEVEHSPLWCNTLPENLSLDKFIATENMQRQLCAAFYRINGAIYISSVENFLVDVNLYKEGSFAYVMSQMRSVDIDTEYDFDLAALLQRLNKKSEENR